MAEHWFLAVRCRGNLNTTLTRLRNYVRERRLAGVIPSVRYERGAQAKRRGEYYIILKALEISLEDLIDRLKDCSIGELLRNHLTEADITKWVSGEVATARFFRQIYIQKGAVTAQLNDDLFERVDQDELLPEDNEAFNRLLYWLSAAGGGTWQAFQNACVQLAIPDKPRHVFRRLRLLGHIEYFDQGKRWQVCPPCVVQSADESYFYLAGQRTQSTLKALGNFEKVPQRGAPDLIKVQNAPSSAIFRSAGKASLRLAQCLPKWQELPAHWSTITLPSLNYQIHRWDGGDFMEQCEAPDRIGMYRYACRTEEVRYAFYDGEQLKQGDWYGLQYVANAHLSIFPHCRYSPTGNRCALDAHLPDLHERALVLASGVLPEQTRQSLYFQRLSHSVIATLAEKLGFSLEICEE